MTQPPLGGGAQRRPDPQQALNEHVALPPGLQVAAAPGSGAAPAPVPVVEPAAQAPEASPPAAPEQPAGAARHLLWSAKKDSKPIVALWLIPTKDGCDLRSDVYPVKSLRVDPVRLGPYKFQRAEDAQAFAQEAARALIHLGCQIVENERPSAPTPPTPGSSLRVAPPTGA